MYNLPIQIRRWFIERLVKQFEKEKEEMDRIKNKK